MRSLATSIATLLICFSHAAMNFKLLKDDINDPLWYIKYIKGNKAEFSGASTQWQPQINRNQIFNYVQQRSFAKVKKPMTPFNCLDKLYFVSGDKQLYGGVKNKVPSIVTANCHSFQKEGFGFAQTCSDDGRFVFGWGKNNQQQFEPFIWDLKKEAVINIKEHLNTFFEIMHHINNTGSVYFYWFNSCIRDQPLIKIPKNSSAQILGKGDDTRLILTFPHFAVSFNLTSQMIELIPNKFFEDTEQLNNLDKLRNFYQNDYCYKRFASIPQSEKHLGIYYNRNTNLTMIISDDGTELEKLQGEVEIEIQSGPKKILFLNYSNSVKCYCEEDKGLDDINRCLIHDQWILDYWAKPIHKVVYINENGDIYGTCWIQDGNNRILKPFKITWNQYTFQNIAYVTGGTFGAGCMLTMTAFASYAMYLFATDQVHYYY